MISLILFFLFVTGGEFTFFCCVLPVVIVAIIFILTFINNNQKREVERREAAEEERQAMIKEVENQVKARRKSERFAVFKELSEKFLLNPEYTFLKNFVRKFENKGSQQEILKLKMLLENKNWNFTVEELNNLVDSEYKAQEADKIREKILLNDSSNRKKLISAFLNHYQIDNSQAISVLADIFQEKLLHYEGFAELRTEIKEVEKEIELKNFEKNLIEEREQIYLDIIDKLNGYEFENFLKTLFSKMGYRVEQTKLSGDQGADLVVIKFGEKTVIQAKRFGGKVGNKAVQEIMAAISLYQAKKGMVITNNYFTPSAVELANANKIELIDRDGLEELINKHW